MALMQISDFGDLLATTLANYDEPNYTDISADLQDFPAAKRLIDANKIKHKSGTNCGWKVKVTSSNAAMNVAVTDHDPTGNIVDGFVDASVQWRKSMTRYYFYEEEMVVNMSPKRLVDLIKAREDDAKGEWIKLLEQNFWRLPSSSDSRTPLGIPYFVYKNATAGFNGGIPSGFSTVAGLSPTTYSGWNNYTFQYAGYTMDDLVRKTRVMMKKTGFKPPVKTPSNNTGTRRGLFSTLTLTQRLADLVDARNDNLGNDLSKNDDGAMIGRATVEWIPQLDEDTTDPLYLLDFGVIKVAVLADRWMKRKVISPYPGQRNVSAVFIDSNYAFLCYNRRLCGVGATGTTYP